MKDNAAKKVIVIGAGLAGSEAAFALAEAGVEVILCESKRVAKNPAQKITHFAELVCTNSLKSKLPHTGHGLLKVEMEALNSLVLKVAEECSVPAGDALAVDREQFSLGITRVLESHSKVTVIDQDISDPLKIQSEYSADAAIIATGPLTTDGLSEWILDNLSDDDFYFYDAIAPVVDADSLDMNVLYSKDRHGEELGGDYLNVPLNQEQYEKFITELVNAEKVQAKDFEEYKFFESCLPVDIMAERGMETARFSCMKPIGLENPETGERPYAVVQLRKENLFGDAYNMVGFQTRLTYGEQLRVFRTLPGFSEASFLHLGSVHRNSFLHAKKLLNFDLSSKKFPELYFAGQITGVEGYTESASMGQYVAWQLLRKLNGKESVQWPVETGFGALVNYLMTLDKPVPSNINIGLLPSVALTKEQRRDRKNRKRVKKELVAARARESFANFIDGIQQ